MTNLTRSATVLACVLVLSSTGAVQAQTRSKGPDARRAAPDLVSGVQASGPYKVGQVETFTIVVRNAGPGPAGPGVSVTDAVPTEFTDPLSAQGAGWSCAIGGALVTCAYVGGPVPAGANFPPIIIKAKAIVAGFYQNCAQVKPLADPNPGNNMGCVQGKLQAGINLQDNGGPRRAPGAGPGPVDGPRGPVPGRGPERRVSDLSMRKTVRGPVVGGQLVNFDLVVINNGPGTVNNATGVRVVDTLPAGFVGPVTWTGAGWSCVVSFPSVSCVYSGSPAVNAGQALPTLTIRARAGERPTFVNCAVVSARPGFDPNPGNDRSCVEGRVQLPPKPEADILIRKSGGGPFTVGQMASFTLRPLNDGTSQIYSSMGVVVTDLLPAGFGQPISFNANGWNCITSGNGPYLVTCTLTATSSYAPGEPLPPIVINARVVGPPGGSVNCADIRLDKVTDVRPANNRGCIDVVIRPREGGKYDLRIDKKGPGPLAVGQTAVFVLSPFNVGPAPVNASSGITVTDSLPSPPFGGAAAVNGGPNWDCSASSGLNVSCRYIGPAVGGNQPMPQITISAVVRRPGEYRNCAEIALTKAGPDTEPRNNRDCVDGPITEDKAVDVSIRKRGPASLSVGQTASFTLDPQNNGGTTLTAGSGLAVVDMLPANFGAPVTANNLPNWTCAVTPGPPFTVTCNYVGAPVPQGGAFPTIVISARATAPGAWTNCARVGFRTGGGPIDTGPDTVPGDNKDCIEGRVTRPKPDSDLSIQKSLHPGPLGYGATPLFDLVVTNVGAALPAGAVLTVTDAIPAGMEVYTVLGPWYCTPQPPLTGPANISCSHSLTSPLPNGQTVNLQLGVRFVGPAKPAYENCASVIAHGSANSQTPIAETDTTNNRDCETVVLPPPAPPALVLSKTLLSPCLNVSGAAVCTFQFTVTNTGTAPYAGPVHFNDTMSYATVQGTSVSGVTGGWTCSANLPIPCHGNVSLQGGASTSFNATFTVNGAVMPTQNCVQLTSPVTLAPTCVPITYVANTPPVLSIEKVVEKDCTGTPPDTHCRFKVRIFNNGPGAYTGTLSFSDLVTSFGTPTGNVSLVAPLPSGWTCSAPNPMTCTSGVVTIPQGGMVAATLWMDMQPPIPPDTNCARLNAPGMPSSCVGMGPPRFDMSVDSNFMPVSGQPGFHDFAIYVNSNPSVMPGYQIKLNGSLTSAYGANTFSTMTIQNSPGWTCSPTTWAAFQCMYTVPAGYTGGSIVLKLRTSYPSAAIGSAFNYTVTVEAIGNADPNSANDTRSVNGSLF